MSGPKRARYTYNEPVRGNRIQERIDVLTDFSDGLADWLSQNGAFLEKHLGQKGVDEAWDAYEEVQDCINDELPDAGFDAYGDAWNDFNRLWRKAADEKAKRRREEIARERRRREAVARRLLPT